MDDQLILKTSGLGKRFGRRWAVKDLNLAVRRGEVFGFLGPNGAGKSTTIRMLLSLIRPTEGNVALFGLPLRKHRRETLARVGGLVEAADFYLNLSARRNLRIIGDLLGGIPSRAIDEALAIVGLETRADDRVRTFSHGMKQRLGIGQALLGFPELIILDEPSSGLDPQGIKEVRDLIRRLSRERDITIFLSSHLLGEIEHVADSMAIINAGRLVVQGDVRELLREGSGTVTIEAHPVDRCLALLRNRSDVAEARQEGERVIVTMPLENAGALNAQMVNAGIEVKALVPQRSLEEYFLAITEGATDAQPMLRRPAGKGGPA
jgi:ABC-type multidrug transport system ATPase subunit